MAALAAPPPPPPRGGRGGGRGPAGARPGGGGGGDYRLCCASDAYVPGISYIVTRAMALLFIAGTNSRRVKSDNVAAMGYIADKYDMPAVESDV